MKKLLTLLLFTGLVNLAFGQKEKEEKIEYYTDASVKHQKFYVAANYSPYFLKRNILTNTFVPSPTNSILNHSSKGGYGQSYGIDLFYKFNSNFHLGLGVNKSDGKYSLDVKTAIDDISGNADTIVGDLIFNTSVSYLNVPVTVAFVSNLSDEWDIDIMPSVEMNFIQNFNRSITQSKEYFDPTNPQFGDLTDVVRQLNWTVAFGLGGNYHITENFTAFGRLHVKYTLQSLNLDDGPSEVLLWLGAQFGVKYYF